LLDGAHLGLEQDPRRHLLVRETRRSSKLRNYLASLEQAARPVLEAAELQLHTYLAPPLGHLAQRLFAASAAVAYTAANDKKLPSLWGNRNWPPG